MILSATDEAKRPHHKPEQSTLLLALLREEVLATNIPVITKSTSRVDERKLRHRIQLNAAGSKKARQECFPRRNLRLNSLARDFTELAREGKMTQLLVVKTARRIIQIISRRTKITLSSLGNQVLGRQPLLEGA